MGDKIERRQALYSGGCDTTQDEDSCVSNVAEITAADLQMLTGTVLCDIRVKRKQIKLCREFNPDMRLLGNAILHHRKSIANPHEAERLLGLAKKKKTLKK